MQSQINRRTVESSFLRYYNLPDNCGKFSASCSVAHFWVGFGLSIQLPIELFFHNRNLSLHRQETCSWALHTKARVWSLLLQKGWSIPETVELLTKETCPVWSDGLGHMTCPSRLADMLTEALEISILPAQQPKPRRLKTHN